MHKDLEFVYCDLGNTWEQNGDHNDGGFVIQWCVKGIGFGELTFYRKGEKVICETECMSREFIKKVMEKFLENVEYKDV